MDKKKTESTGATIGTALKETCWFTTLLFCALRACDIINWSWFWIMSPIFFSWIVGLICLCVAGLCVIALGAKGKHNE